MRVYVVRVIIIFVALGLLSWPAASRAEDKTTKSSKLSGWRNLTWKMGRDNIQRLYAGGAEVLSLDRMLLHKIKVNGARAQVVLQLKALKLYAVIIDIPGVDQAYARGLMSDIKREFGSPHRARPGPVLAPKLFSEKGSMFYAWNMAGGALVLAWGPKRGAGMLYVSTQQWCADVSQPFLKKVVLFAKKDDD